MTLFEQLNYVNAARKNRLKAAKWILNHPETFEELLHYCFVQDIALSHKATMALEFVCLEQLEWLCPHLDYFFEKLPTVKNNPDIRALSHICELLVVGYYKKKLPILVKSFSEEHKKVLTECSFDWMITHQKVACQARAMTCLYYLGTEKKWIHPELKTILQGNMHQGSAGYKARGRKILEKIG